MDYYYAGLDLGQRADPTALAIIEESLWIPGDAPVWVRVGENRCEQRDGWVSPADILPEDLRRVRQTSGPARPPLALKHLERFPLNTPYPAIVRATAELLARPPLAGHTVLLADATGVGRPVIDMLDQAKLNPYAITITGGDAVTQDGREIRVPKRDLAMAVQVLLQNRRLVFAAALPLLDVLKGELQNFEVKITKTGHDTYEAWRTGTHDDLVLAVAMACWYREWLNPGDQYGFSLAYAWSSAVSGWPKEGGPQKKRPRPW